MVDDPSSNAIVFWNATNNSLVVWNPQEFARDLLPKYFKHNDFSSFVQQLNTYDIRKSDPDQWEFANDDLILGQQQLLRTFTVDPQPLRAAAWDGAADAVAGGSAAGHGSAAAGHNITQRPGFPSNIVRFNSMKRRLSKDGYTCNETNTEEDGD